VRVNAVEQRKMAERKSQKATPDVMLQPAPTDQVSAENAARGMHIF
jgi:hypothetical protein